MPLQNRVQPTGDIVALPARGLFMGNRGILHNDAQQLGRARWRHKAWVTCVLAFKGCHRAVMTPHHYTELFFHEEAVAFAAGHRPCAECRRADYTAFCDAADIRPPIAAFDSHLHAQRVVPRSGHQVRYPASVSSLPQGTFVLCVDGQPHLVQEDYLLPYSATGYGPPLPRPGSGTVTVLTPKALVEVLRAGYQLKVAPHS